MNDELSKIRIFNSTLKRKYQTDRLESINNHTKEEERIEKRKLKMQKL